MKPGEKGFTQIEVVVAMVIMALVVLAAGAATFQVFKGTRHSNDRVTAVHQVQNAGYRISQDAQMAQSATAANLTLPDFLVLSWTEWDDTGDPTYHSVTYSFKDLADDIGKLMRSHWSSAGANEQTLVAKNIYYNPDDPDDTSKANYQNQVLTVQLTALSKGISETREYQIKHRPNF